MVPCAGQCHFATVTGGLRHGEVRGTTSGNEVLAPEVSQCMPQMLTLMLMMLMSPSTSEDRNRAAPEESGGSEEGR
jgi:hypothetical protein